MFAHMLLQKAILCFLQDVSFIIRWLILNLSNPRQCWLVVRVVPLTTSPFLVNDPRLDFARYFPFLCSR
jgi:hypothetical protein